MKLRILALVLAGLSLISAGCRSHMHAGGGQGFEADAGIGPSRSYTLPPVVVPASPPASVPIPDPLPPR
jgi:hypothetical protein